MEDEKEEKRYFVRKPFAGVMNVEVEAESEGEAQKKADELFDKVKFDFDSSDGVEVEEWDTYEHITQGNVLYVSLNETEIEEID